MNATDDEILARQDVRQTEARAVLADLDLLALLGRIGMPTHTGSSALGLMVVLDIDVTTVCPILDIEPVFAVGRALAAHSRVRRLNFRNDAGHWRTEPVYPDGLYWQVEYVSQPGDTWNLDLWMIAEGTTQFDLEAMQTLPARLDRENRAAIVRIKELLRELPGERIRSYLVYEAVLDHGIRTADAFEVWWNDRSRPT